MPEVGRLANRTGLTVGFLIISAAVALLIAWYLDKWWYFVPVMLIAGGVYVMVIGALTARPSEKEGGSSLVYTLLWGGILAIIGAEWLAYDVFNAELVFLVVVLLVFIGLMAILGFLLRPRR